MLTFYIILVGLGISASPVFSAEPDNVARYIDTLKTSKDGQQITVAIQRLGQIGQTTPDVCAAIARAAKEDESPYDSHYQWAMETYQKLKCPESAIEEISAHRISKYLNAADLTIQNKAFISLYELEKFKTLSKNSIDALFAVQDVNNSYADKIVYLLTVHAANDPRLEPFLKKIIAETKHVRAYEIAYAFFEEKHQATLTPGQASVHTDAKKAFLDSRMDKAFQDLESGSKKSYDEALGIILSRLSYNKLRIRYEGLDKDEKAIANRLLEIFKKSPDKDLRSIVVIPKIAMVFPKEEAVKLVEPMLKDPKLCRPAMDTLIGLSGTEGKQKYSGACGSNS